MHGLGRAACGDIQGLSAERFAHGLDHRDETVFEPMALLLFGNCEEREVAGATIDDEDRCAGQTTTRSIEDQQVTASTNRYESGGIDVPRRRVDPRATSAYGARLHDPPPPKLRDGRSRKGRDDMTDTHVGRRGLTVGLAALGAAALARLAAPRRAEGSQ